MDQKNVVKLARDVFHGTVDGNYSVSDANTALVNALVAANGGSTVVNYKTLRRNSTELFEILEETLPPLIIEGLQGDEFFMNLVEERNLAEGDTNEFIVPDNSTLIVSEIANGVATPRRQRIGEATKVAVKTTIHAIRMYEELSRVLAGRVDWNTFVNKVTEAFRANLLNDMYTALSGITANTVGLSATYVKSGSYSEEDLMKIVDHVEAATGKTAYIVGTKPALRKCTAAVVSDKAKDDVYGTGFYGKLDGVPMIAIKNRHKVGTDEFIFPDDKLFILAGDEKLIKLVREGSATIKYEDGMSYDNRDMSMEYLYMEKYGVAIVITGKIGVYTIS